MQFKASTNSSTLISLVKDPSAPRFQFFLDVVSVPIVLLGQTMAGVYLKNFDDNYLCLFYILKLVIDGLFYMFADTEALSFGKKLFALRMSFDILSFFGGYLLMKYDNLHEICYIVFCTIIFLELSASSICVFLIGLPDIGEKVDMENQSPLSLGETDRLANSDCSPMTQSEVGQILKDKSPSKSSMISGSTMAGSTQSYKSGITAF